MSKKQYIQILLIFLALFLFWAVFLRARPMHHPDRSLSFYPISFNSPGLITGVVLISPIPHIGFTHPFTEEQLQGVFPAIDIPLVASATYLVDGTLIEIRAFTPSSEIYDGVMVRIYIGIGVLPLEFGGPITLLHMPFRRSRVAGVPVTVVMYGRRNGINEFRAEFSIGEANYRIQFSDNRRSGQIKMIELVNQIILGGTDGFVLFRPT